MSNQYLLRDLKVLHLELTSRCNLLCPMCARTQGANDGNVLHRHTDLELFDTDPAILRDLLDTVNKYELEHIFVNGNFGDPIMYPHLLEVVTMFRDAGVGQITLSTNGSAQTEEWWRTLAGIFRKPDKVIFAIDGLGDTNHLYRVNSNFEKIMKNAKAFIDAGGMARWDFIGFAHNEHQIEEAKQLAKDMGFYKFRYKKSNRYVIDINYEAEGTEEIVNEVVNRQEIKFVAKVKKEEKETVISTPTDKSNTTQNVENVIKKHKTFENYVKTTEIDCQTRRDSSAFIDFKGRVWPCCWAAHHYSEVGSNKQRDADVKALNDKYGEHWNDLNYHGPRIIAAHPFYANDLVESWDTPDRPYICGKTCGKELDFRGNGEQNFEDEEYKWDVNKDE